MAFKRQGKASRVAGVGLAGNASKQGHFHPRREGKDRLRCRRRSVAPSHRISFRGPRNPFDPMPKNAQTDAALLSTTIQVSKPFRSIHLSVDQSPRSARLCANLLDKPLGRASTFRQIDVTSGEEVGDRESNYRQATL